MNRNMSEAMSAQGYLSIEQARSAFPELDFSDNDLEKVPPISQETIQVIKSTEIFGISDNSRTGEPVRGVSQETIITKIKNLSQ
jgi:hypothetical protein